jgi:hypothetical protein
MKLVLCPTRFFVAVLATLGLLLGCLDNELLVNVKPMINRAARSTTAAGEIALPKTKTVPSFEDGGVIFILHIPKCGGTTIRKGFQGRKNVKYLFSSNRNKYDLQVQSMDQWVQYGPEANRTGIFEVHARNNPTLLDLCDQLKEWRRIANENKIPFFAFTVLREPTSFAISYFNYYHGKRWQKRRFEYLPEHNMTEDNFIRTMHFNPQCLFLTRSEQAYQRNFPEKRENLSEVECKTALECLISNMDWVGTTECLRNETIPLLSYLIDSSERSQTETMGSYQEEKEKEVKDENGSYKFFALDDASVSTKEYLNEMTRWDQHMYNKIRQVYSINDFDFGSL